MDKPKEYYNEYDGGNYSHQTKLSGEKTGKKIYDGMVIKDDIGNYGEITIKIKGDKIFAKDKDGKSIFLNGVHYFGDETKPYFTKKGGITVLAFDFPGANRYFLEDGNLYRSSLDKVIGGTKEVIKTFIGKK